MESTPDHQIGAEFVLVRWLALQMKQQLWLAYEKPRFLADMKQQLWLAYEIAWFPGDSTARKWSSVFVRPEVIFSSRRFAPRGRRFAE